MTSCYDCHSKKMQSNFGLKYLEGEKFTEVSLVAFPAMQTTDLKHRNDWSKSKYMHHNCNILRTPSLKGNMTLVNKGC